VKYNPLDDHSVFCSPSSAAKTRSEDPEARADRLEVEVAKLKDMLDKAKSINDAMWENLVQQTAAHARSHA
jgi:pre-rRNA-processing protein IPI3